MWSKCKHTLSICNKIWEYIKYRITQEQMYLDFAKNNETNGNLVKKNDD